MTKAFCSAILGIALLAGSAPHAAAAAAGDEPPWESLFDGRTLDGWRAVGGDATYAVDGGEILGVHGTGPNAFLRTEREFGDFVLELEMRWDEPGNSGIMFRAHQRGGDGRTYGLQYELDPSERAWSGGIYDEARRKWLVPLADDDPARGALDLEGWNHVRIEAVGGRVRTWLNDVPVADLADATDLSGFIALQVHSGHAGRIRFRNIRIRDLGEHRWTSDFIAAPDSWVLPDGGTVAADGRGGIEASQPGPIRTKAALGDFAVRFDLDVCDRPSIVRFREWRPEGGPAYGQVALTADQAALSLGAADRIAGAAAFDAPAGRRRVTLTAVGDDVTVAVDETHLGRAHREKLPARGILSIRSGCGSTRVHELAWADLDGDHRDEPPYRALDVPEAPVLSSGEALAAFRIAPGYRVELVAAEPLVQDPVAMAWDERGRLYVVEMRGYMPDAFGHGDEEPVGRVVRLEDTDADGRMDRRTVYLDGLVLPRAVAVVDGGVLIGEPPHLWLCRDTDDDGRCDEKRSVGSYGENEGGSVEHRENALMPGLDNWLYNAKSSRRFRLDAGRLVVGHTVARGQWGMTQDDEGRLYYNNNSNWIFADFYPPEGVLRQGARDELPGIGAVLLPAPEVYSVRVNPGVNRAYLPGFLRPDGRLKAPTAASGIVAYRGDQFPDAAHDVFVPEPAANALARFRLSGGGIALAAEHLTYADAEWGRREFLASTDERFRPVDAKIGPDGALYVIDMYRGIIQDVTFLTEELREQIYERGLEAPIGLGRIWRIVYADGPLRRAPPDLAAADARELVALLGHANGWQRDTAQRLLVALPELGERELGMLRQLAEGSDARAATHALWVLEGRGALDRETVLAALGADHPRVALQALRAGAARLTAADLLELAQRLGDWQAGEPAERIAQQLVVALARHNGEPGVLDFLAGVAVRRAGNPYLRVAVIAAARGREAALLARVLATELPEPGRSELLAGLTANAYRTLVHDADAPGLEALLDRTGAVAARDPAAARAMLLGFRQVLRDARFEPARLSRAHPLFESARDPQSPLWAAAANARFAFTWPGDHFHDVPPLSAEAQARRARGREFYERVCASCHHRRGIGSAGLAPPLAYSPWVAAPPEALARIVLQGLRGPVNVDGHTWNGIMPGHGTIPELDDELAAGLLTYVRTAFGNNRGAVTPELVRRVRVETAERSGMWTVDELAPYLEAGGAQ